MELKITIDTKEAQRVLRDYALSKLGDADLKVEDIVFEVKSKQNYRSEWEQADFRAVVHKIGA